MEIIVHIGIVRDKPPISLKHLNHGVPTLMDFQHSPVVYDWLHIPIQSRNFSQTGQNINCGHKCRRPMQPRGLGTDDFTELREQTSLQFTNPLFSAEDRPLKFLQLGGNKPFCVGQRLLADELFRHLSHVGLRYFNVVAEHFVEANFKRTNSGAIAFLSLQSRDEILAFTTSISQRIKIVVKSISDNTTIRNNRRRFICESLFNQRGNVTTGIELSD